MQNRGVWLGFLMTCFAIVGMVGLFASYSTSIPLERAMHQIEILDQAVEPGQAEPAIRQALGREALPVLQGAGDDRVRLERARAAVTLQAQAEQGEIATRTRWMIVVVTVLAAGLGAGLLLMASRPVKG